MKKYMPFSYCISSFEDASYEKIKPPVLLFAIACVTLD